MIINLIIAIIGLIVFTCLLFASKGLTLYIYNNFADLTKKSKVVTIIVDVVLFAMAIASIVVTVIKILSNRVR